MDCCDTESINGLDGGDIDVNRWFANNLNTKELDTELCRFYIVRIKSADESRK